MCKPASLVGIGLALLGPWWLPTPVAAAPPVPEVAGGPGLAPIQYPRRWVGPGADAWAPAVRPPGAYGYPYAPGPARSWGGPVYRQPGAWGGRPAYPLTAPDWQGGPPPPPPELEGWLPDSAAEPPPPPPEAWEARRPPAPVASPYRGPEPAGMVPAATAVDRSPPEVPAAMREARPAALPPAPVARPGPVPEPGRAVSPGAAPPALPAGPAPTSTAVRVPAPAAPVATTSAAAPAGTASLSTWMVPPVPTSPGSATGPTDIPSVIGTVRPGEALQPAAAVPAGPSVESAATDRGSRAPPPKEAGSPRRPAGEGSGLIERWMMPLRPLF